MRSISRYWICLAVFVTALSVTIWMKSRTAAQPTYHGLSLSYWMDQLPGANNKTRGIPWGNLDNPPRSPDKADEAIHAISSIGTNALPYIVTELNVPTKGSREKFQAAWNGIKNFWQRLVSRNKTAVLPSFGSEKTSGQMRHWKAAAAIHALGPEAKPLLPRLVTMLDHPLNEDEEIAGAAYALTAMGPDGLKPMMPILTRTSKTPGLDWPRLCVIWALGQTPEAGREVLPQLLSKLQDKDENIRMAAVWTLGQLHTNEEVIVPALASQLGDKDSSVVGMTEQSLKGYGIETTRPMLKANLTNSLLYVRIAATNAYIARYRDEAAKLGLK